jgi:short-subunit dehydrogenase
VNLVGGNVLITGATGGIGQAIARAFASHGASLVLSGRRTEVLQPLATEVRGRSLACDLSKRGDVGKVCGEAVAAELDVFVANAALPASGLVTELTQDEIDRMLDVNLRAPVALARAIAPGMIERGRGHMVFVSSLSGKAASPASSVYSATKFGLRGFALGLREDLRPHRVGVSTVLPGFVSDAGMFADAQVNVAEGHIKLPPGVATRTPEQVAAAVIKAIERNRAELDVASALVRFGATFAGAAPQLAATASRLMGSNRIAGEVAKGQRDKRT